MSARWFAPVDPSCPEVRKFHADLHGDPMTAECGCVDEIVEAWESKHRAKCERCRQFGAENIEIRD